MLNEMSHWTKAGGGTALADKYALDNAYSTTSQLYHVYCSSGVHCPSQLNEMVLQCRSIIRAVFVISRSATLMAKYLHIGRPAKVFSAINNAKFIKPPHKQQFWGI